MESHKDNDEDSEEKDGWGLMYMSLMRNLGMSINEINHLSYPQFKCLTKLLYEPSTFNVIIPYMGSSKDEGEEEVTEVKDGEHFASIIAQMNSDFR